jgi:hypothetical protein
MRFAACCATRKPPKALTANLGDLRRHQVGEGAAGAAAGVIDHDIRRPDLALDHPEQPLDLVGIGGVAGKGPCPGLGADRAKLFDFPRRQRNADALPGEQPRQRCAETLAGADDQGDLVVRRFHGAVLE